MINKPTFDDAVSKAEVLETYADLYDVFDDNKKICTYQCADNRTSI